MLGKLDTSRLLFIDIETVCGQKSFSLLDSDRQQLREHKSKKLISDNQDLADCYFEKAGIFSEFGKIVCISVGKISTGSEGQQGLRVRSFTDHDEKALLSTFFNDLQDTLNHPQTILCGHNLKEFDAPWISRRGLIHGLSLPACFDNTGKKPREVQHLDTLELWRFGDYKNFTSLNLLAHVFNIPTPKDDISGADVSHVYRETEDIQRIATYCEKDVVTTANVLMRILGKAIMERI